MDAAAAKKTSKKGRAVKPADKPFYTAEMRRWLGGYEPKLARSMGGARTDTQRQQDASTQREARAAAGIGWGSGALVGISAKADLRLAAMPLRLPRKGNT